MTNQDTTPKTGESFIDHLWEKHCLPSDGENADRMFYEGFHDAMTELGEELMRLAEGERVNAEDNAYYPIAHFIDGAESLYKAARNHNQAIDTLKKHIISVTGVE